MTRIETLELMSQSRFGRRFGWFVERDGKRLAALSAPRLEDMFWVSYVIEPLGETAAERALVLTNAFWESPPGLTYRSRLSGLVAPFAFASLAGLNGERVTVRGLYVSMASSRVERVVLLLRGWWRFASRDARRAYLLRGRGALEATRPRSA